jgi:hypothetical protein
MQCPAAAPQEHWTVSRIVLATDTRTQQEDLNVMVYHKIIRTILVRKSLQLRIFQWQKKLNFHLVSFLHWNRSYDI